MIGDADDFTFYLNLIKPMILNLPHLEDRIKAAIWLKKLQELHNDNPDNEIDVEYLKLLLFALQNDKLGGIFQKIPPDEPLQSLSEKTTAELISLVKVSEDKKPATPRVYAAIGGDLCEFVSVQEIPKFGMHGYYAISTEKLPKWVHSKPIGPRQILFKYLPCFKDTCELAKNSDSNKKTVERQSRVDRLTMENIYSAKATNDREKASKEKEIKSQFDEETTKQISPQMLQAQRSELPGVESRPCWGTSRYYERLIDQSPHYTADLDLSEADALLHVFKDRKMKLSGKENVNSSCAFVSNRRRQVERMLDLPPCAVDPGDKELSDDESRTCFPEAEEKINISCVDHCFEEETDSLNFSESSNNFQSNYFDKMKDYPSHSKRHNISEHQKFGFKTNYMSDKNKHHLNNYNNEQSRFSSFSKNLSSNKRHKNSNLTDDSVYYPTKDYFKGALHSDWEKRARYPKSFDSEQDAKPFLLQNFIEPDELIPGFTSKINPAKVQIHQENRSGRLEESYTINPEYTKWSIKPQASENFVEDLTDTEFDAPVENEPSISIIRRRHNIKRENEESPYSYSFSWEDVIDQNRDGSPQYREELRGQFSQMRNPKEDLSYLSLDSSSDLEINLNESPESFREFKRSRNVDRPYNYHELFETPRRSNIQESFNSQNSNTRRKVMKEKLAPRENNLMNTRDENFTPMAHSSFREK